MNEYISILKKTKLFSGVGESDIPEMLACLSTKLYEYKKGEAVIRQGEYLSSLIILVCGKLQIQSEDYWGNRSILNIIHIGDMFGEAYTTPGSEAVMNDVIALEDSAAVFLDASKIISSCCSGCRFHLTVVQNLFYEISDKNRSLVQKIGHMSMRTTRGKLISYLSLEAKKQNSPIIEIPFNRQQLADYLSVDRSAMSNELGKMRDEGMIEFDKNRFILKQI